MTDLRVRQIRFRGILESRGERTVEAELELVSGWSGIASAPIAIKPGRLETNRSRIPELGSLDEIPSFASLRIEIEGEAFSDQQDFDSHLESLEITKLLGADVKMALSIAFCRAVAKAAGESLVDHLLAISGTRPAIPRILANIYSGGIHHPTRALPFQQIMFVPSERNLVADVTRVLQVFNGIENRVLEEFAMAELSASSGLIVRGAQVEYLLDILVEMIHQQQDNNLMPGIGIDVAGEHLREADGYRLQDVFVAPDALVDLHLRRFKKYPIVYFEDPFDPADVLQWRQLIRDRPATVAIFGDDLFATDSLRIDRELADGIVLKINQTGTLSGALRAAQRARELGLALCVSHRSGETEDNFICDFAVAIGAAFIKVGGPRRGDRISKYNRLLWLAETCKDSMSACKNFRGDINEKNDADEGIVIR